MKRSRPFLWNGAAGLSLVLGITAALFSLGMICPFDDTFSYLPILKDLHHDHDWSLDFESSGGGLLIDYTSYDAPGRVFYDFSGHWRHGIYAGHSEPIRF